MSADRSGEVLDGRYELVRRIGEGGMGTVYEARHTQVGRRFAVKFLRHDLSGDESLISRFHREARAAGSLESDHIVAIEDSGRADDGAPYIVMEYLRGETLRALLARHERLPLHRALDIVLQMAHGLEQVHLSGVVHRDLKPDNILVQTRWDRSDHVKLLDFGIAKVSGPTGHSISKPGDMVGTLEYMPPEQLRGDTDLDHRADIYSLGAILYELLTGEVPHPSDAAHLVMYNTLNKPHAPLRQSRGDLPEALSAFVDRLLCKDADGRPASVKLVIDELTQCRRQALGVATSAEGSATQPSQGSAVRPGLPVVAPRLVSRGLLAAAAVLVTALVLTGWFTRSEAPSSARGQEATALAPSVQAPPRAPVVGPPKTRSPGAPPVAETQPPRVERPGPGARVAPGRPSRAPAAKTRLARSQPAPSSDEPAVPAVPFDRDNPFSD